jgi:hypothetical protein
MSYRSLIPWLYLLVVLAGLTSGSGCANIIPPAGGPRDSIPPVLLRVTPADSTLQFTGNRIVFTFNEFIEVQNPQQFLVVSPLANINPTVDYRLNTMTVRLRDTLEPNTTYTLAFGDAVKDFTEGNVLKGFSYTFSTGRYIDSLELRGKVILAETGKIDTTLLVMLHSNRDDSAVVKERPRYITRLDASGQFVFRNLPPKTFYLYALKDEGGTKRYFNDKQLFAFADKPVVVGTTTDAGTLYAYSTRTASTFPSVTLPTRLGKGGGKPGVTTADKRLRYSTSVVANQQDLLSDFTITFEQPLQVFDSSRIRLFTDSAFNPATDYRFYLDSTRRQIRLTHKWKENTLYRVVMDKDFAEDSSGKKLLKSDTLSFTTKKKTDYGSLKLKIRNLDFTKNPVLLIMVGETIYKSYPMSGAEVSESLFPPGEYELRILADNNKNGKWDPGEFFGKHRQPEIVKVLDRKITVKANFVNEFELSY